jgi:predicted dehydrogenase
MGRWGILGAAAIANGALIPAVRRCGNSSVVAVASRSGDRAREMAGAHGISRAYGTYEELLQADEIDHVYVALPNNLHAEWTIKALRAGKNVLCEKPLAASVAEVNAVAAAGRESDKLVMEAFMYRFNERTVAFVRDAPEPVHVQAAFSYPQPDQSNIRRKRALAGGALMDLGCYSINVVRWLLGEPEEVRACAHADEVDLSVSAALSFPSGQIATIWASFETVELQEVRVVGTARVVSTQHRPFGAWFDPNEPDRLAPYTAMVDAFESAARGSRPSPIPIGDSIGNAAVIERVRTSAGLT